MSLDSPAPGSRSSDTEIRPKVEFFAEGGLDSGSAFQGSLLRNLTPSHEINESHQGDTTLISWILQPYFHSTRKRWRTTPCTRPPEAQTSCGGSKLQDGDYGFHFPKDPQEGLIHILGSSRYIHTHYFIQELQKLSPPPL
ncbi:hypothetical protein AYI69_g843 [Smittium culicis]|uniref:Uncharacterized protein n=1 Tax=Smittium culicis TaxID=133412 RepID=A0A1R1YRX7_9FUNG|nr:hypothetical protein AYI69_g843 [Smittium culicis]